MTLLPLIIFLLHLATGESGIGGGGNTSPAPHTIDSCGSKKNKNSPDCVSSSRSPSFKPIAKVPSTAPSITTTPFPTVLSGADKGSSSPDASPLLNSSLSPSTPDGSTCLTVNGTYGSVDVNSVPSVVNFQYTLEVTENFTVTELTSNVLPHLERMMNAALVPVFFETTGCIADNATRSARRRHLLVDDFGPVGLSPHPNDFVETELACIGENCFVVNGSLTLFFYNSSDALQRCAFTSTAHDELKERMYAGSFDGQGMVVSVRYVERDNINCGKYSSGTDNSNGSTVDNGINEKILVLFVGVGGAFLLLLFVAGIVLRRRQRATTSILTLEADGNTTTA